MLAYPIERRIEAVACDVVLVTGELDETSPEHWLAELAARAPGEAHTVVVPRASHQAMFTHADQVSTVIVTPVGAQVRADLDEG